MREICVSKSIRLAYSWKEIDRFSLFYLVFEGTVFKYKPLGGLCSEGPFNERFFALPGLRGLHLEGLIHGGTYFRNFTV